MSSFRFQVLGFGFRVSGFGFRVSGFGFRVSGFGFRVYKNDYLSPNHINQRFLKVKNGFLGFNVSKGVVSIDSFFELIL